MGILCESVVDWTATGAMIGGIATGVYAIFTLFLWLTAKNDLKQTKQLHQDNINLTKKLHEADSRPWIQVKNIQISHRGGAVLINDIVDKVVSNKVDTTYLTEESLAQALREEWIAEVEISNRGKAPARVLTWHVSWIDPLEPLRIQWSADNFLTVVMPGDSVQHVFVLFAITPGTTKLPVSYTVEVLYSMGSGEPYKTSAHFVQSGAFGLDVTPSGVEFE